jgi:hypothetical protein
MARFDAVRAASEAYEKARIKASARHWADTGTADGYQNVKRALRVYEEPRLR